jgi:folate-binding protein YgfZ
MSVEAAILPGRSLIEVAGEDHVSFLQGLITNDVEGLDEGGARFAGLLSPQGKILFDFFAINTGAAIVLDCATAIAADLLKRLTLYKLRAKVVLTDVSARWNVAAAWGGGAEEFLKTSSGLVFADPRLLALGYRALSEAPFETSGNYEAHRVVLCIPEGGKDYAYGDAFPHEACYDLLNGVNFKKGCYVGQEVVSRMQHRGTARTRVLQASADGALQQGGIDILDDNFAVGRIGTVSETQGIALARIDRVGDAQSKGRTLTAGGVPVTLSVPAWANYALSPAPAGHAPAHSS